MKESNLNRAMNGILLGMIAGMGVGWLAGGWPAAYVGVLIGGVLGCIASALKGLENRWQMRTILTVFGGALLGLVVGPLLLLPLARLGSVQNFLLLAVAVGMTILAGAILGVLVSMRWLRHQAAT